MQTPGEERSAGWSSETRDAPSSTDLYPVAWASTDSPRSVNDTPMDPNEVVFKSAERLRAPSVCILSLCEGLRWHCS